MFIGTDSPQLNVKTIIEAVQLMVGSPEQAVIGPATDGGFYLFGSTMPVARSIWEAIPYSRKDTLDKLQAQLDAVSLGYHLLSAEQDVDTIQDLKSLFSDLSSRNVEELSNAQTALLAWLRENVAS